MTTFPRITTLVALAVTTLACTEEFAGLNVNPNSPTDAPSEFLIVSAMERGTAEAMGSLSRGVIGYWVQHTSAIEYAWDDRYDVRPETFNGAWNGIYSGPLSDIEVITAKETVAGQPNRVAVAQILKAWLFQNITDIWGDAPFSEALRGAENVLPIYDSQEDIYRGINQLLEDARNKIELPGPSFGNADVIYGGDMTKWHKFSASLQLRIGMRLSDADPALAQAMIAKALADGVFTSRSEEAHLKWLDNDNNANPWWSGTIESAGGVRISATIIDTLKSLNDPRLAIYARPNEDGEYIGMQNGLDDGHGIPFLKRSRIGEWFIRRRESPSVILSYAEVQFLRAEAVIHGWAGGDPKALYEEGIAESMRYYGVPENAIADYLAQPAVQYEPARGIDQINLQKWIALFGNSLEAFANHRRTGIPELLPGPDNVTGGRLPRRMPYPTDEQSLNNANLQAAVARQGGAQLWDKLWFDRRP